jgi:hypothetical protein
MKLPLKPQLMLQLSCEQCQLQVAASADDETRVITEIMTHTDIDSFDRKDLGTHLQ